MRIVSGRRELDDYHGLPRAESAGGPARVVSFLVMSAVSVGASVGALTLVKDTLDRALGPGTVSRALQELDPDDSDLYSLLSTDAAAAPVEKTFAQLKSEEFGRRAFGQRKTPPPQPETSVALTTFMPEPESGFAPSTAPRHEDAEGFVEASRVRGGQTIEAVERTARSM